MDREKVLDKIRKCMALGKSSEPHEAAAAMRQAQKMMEKHGITEAELNAIGFGQEKVACPIQASAGKKIPIVLSRLVSLIMKAFVVEGVVETELRVSDYSYVIRYFGPSDRVMLAAFTHVVIYRAMNSAWAAHLKQRPHLKGDRGARAGFQLGWLDGVWDQLEDFAMDEDERAAIKRGTELVKSQHYGTGLEKAKARNMRVNTGAMNAGEAAGASFKLHRPMGADKTGIGYDGK